MRRLRFAAAAILLIAGAANAQKAAEQTATTIGLLPFNDATGTAGSGIGVTLSRAVQAEFTHSTTKVARVLALPDGVKAEEMDEVKAIETGRAQKVDIVLLGTILEARAEESNRSGWTPTVLRQTGAVNLKTVKAVVTLQVSVLGVASGERLTSLRITGNHSDKRFNGQVYTTLGHWGNNDHRFLDSPLGKAVTAAVVDLVKKVAATPLPVAK
jgi:hypothetical protein